MSSPRHDLAGAGSTSSESISASSAALSALRRYGLDYIPDIIDNARAQAAKTIATAAIMARP